MVKIKAISQSYMPKLDTYIYIYILRYRDILSSELSLSELGSALLSPYNLIYTSPNVFIADLLSLHFPYWNFTTQLL